METRLANDPERIPRLLARAPGLSTRGVARALEVDESTADYHLRRLRKRGRVVAQPLGRELCWYASDNGLCPVLKRAVPPMRRDEVARVARALDEVPATAAALAERAGVGVGAARWAAGILVCAGVARKTASGRVALRDGAATCVVAALSGERCGLWGKCSVSRALAEEAQERL